MNYVDGSSILCLVIGEPFPERDGVKMTREEIPTRDPCDDHPMFSAVKSSVIGRRTPGPQPQTRNHRDALEVAARFGA